MDTQKIIDKRIKEKDEKIKGYRNETQINIQLGQAINLAVQVMNNNNKNPMSFKEELDSLVDFFMDYIGEKREQLNKEIEREKNKLARKKELKDIALSEAENDF